MRRNSLFRSLLLDMNGLVQDIDGNIYRTIIIGNQEWIVENLKVTTYADDSKIPNITESNTTDWFLPSKDELAAMYTNLHAEGVGGFTTVSPYMSSSEADTFTFHQQAFATGVASTVGKGSSISVRACRTFTGTVLAYPLRSYGPAGGLIFAHDGGLVYEAAPADNSNSQVWSNISGQLIGATAQGTAIGTGVTNTAAIIGQAGHTTSGAKLCDDYSYGWVDDTTGAYCWYDNDIANKADYGALYNWYAVDNAAGLVYLERNGVSETDWRVPTEADWLSLTTLLGGNAVAGGKLKSVGYDYFDVPNTGATDEYGFRGRAGGSRSTTGVFTGLRTNGNHHQSDLSTGNYVSRVLFSSFTSLGSTTALNGNGGYSVRLVRDI